MMTTTAIQSLTPAALRGISGGQISYQGPGAFYGVDLPGSSGHGGNVPTGGTDLLVGTTGSDLINALGGNDMVVLGNGTDLGFGGDGNDLVAGGWGNDIVMGGEGDDLLFGRGDMNPAPTADTTDNDIILGGGGNDIIGYALGEGNDTIDGGIGEDTLVITNMSEPMFNVMVQLAPEFASFGRVWDPETRTTSFVDEDGRAVPVSGTIRFGDQLLTFSNIEHFALGG